MKKSIIVLLLIAGSIGVAIAAIADLTGKWSGVLKGPDGNDYPLSYVFKAEGDKLTGTAVSSMGSTEIQNGKITGDSFSFSISLNGMDLPHKGKLYTDSIGLDIDYNGTPLHATLKRAAQ